MVSINMKHVLLRIIINVISVSDNSVLIGTVEFEHVASVEV
jgi:hypothetical protein